MPQDPHVAGARLDEVEYAFHLVDASGDPGAFEVLRAHWVEEVSRAYELTLDLVTADTGLSIDDLIGASCALELGRTVLRSVHGIIRRVDWIGHGADHLELRVHVVPAWSLLEQRVDSRIFQDLTVPEILEAVLAGPLDEYGRRVDLSRLQAEYPRRDYCVQFRESDLAFASRLMAEEGISFVFDQSDDDAAEVLVLVDDNAQFEELALETEGEIPIIGHRPESVDRESLQRLQWSRTDRTSAVLLRTYNWRAPAEPTDAADSVEAPRGRVREAYHHDSRRHVTDARDDAGYDGTDDQVARPALHRREQLAASMRRAVGQSNVSSMTAGRTITVGRHPLGELDGARVLVTRVEHTGSCPERDVAAITLEANRYSNQLECLPVDVPLRPPLAPAKPRVHGPLTARVTGPAGEEIHTDAHGRIRIKFHWDRCNPEDDTASCWVRVAQMWAGAGWGTWFLPRVGMEVVVQFLDGDPDQPLVVGCVYNGSNGVPYTLPDDKTKSTIRTRSSPGSEGFNELRFEDAAGNEEIYVHAQKDHNIEVLNDHTRKVDANETVTVGGNRVVTIQGNHLVEVKGDPAESKNGDNTGGSSFKGSSTAVTGDYKCTASATAYISAPDSITLECPGSSIKLEPGKITLCAGGGATIVLDANALMQSAAGAKVLLDGNALAQSVAGSKVLLDGNALAQSSGGSKVLLDGNALTEASGGGSVLLDANATMTGAVCTAASTSGGKVHLTADAKLEGATTTCVGAGATVKLGGGAAEIKGGSVTSAADGVNTVSGATVALN